MKKTTQPNSVIRFRRWSRKGYSAFASVGHQVVIGALKVGMSLIGLVAGVAHASESADSLSIWRSVEMQDVGVSSSRENPTRSTMLQTPIFDRATEAAAPIQTLEGALRLSPSIDVRERGGKASQADISIRGGSFDQTMVMLNGINFTDARTGHQTHSLPIDIENIAGVELVDGVAGVGAYAGAINIRTAPLKDNYIAAELSAGDYGYLYNALSGALTRGRFNIFGAGSFRKSDGYTYNTDFSNWNGYLRSTYDSKRAGFFDAQLGYQKRAFGSNGFYSVTNPDQYETTETVLGSLRWLKEFSDKFTLNSAVSYRKNYDHYEWLRDTPQYDNYHTTDNVWAEIYGEYKSAWGATTLGGDYTFNHIWSTSLGELQDEPNGKYTKMDARHVGNFYLRHTKDWAKFGISAYAGVSTTPYGTYPLWSASVRYRPAQGLRLELGATESMRLPTFTELYYSKSGYYEPNPASQPEQATTYLLSTSYQRGAWSTLAQVYYRAGRNIIDWTQSAEEQGTTLWVSRQFTELGTFGVELSGSYTPDCFVRRVSASYGYITQDKSSGEYASMYAFEYMQNKGVLTIDFALCRDLTLVVTGSVYDREGEYDPYYLLDARLSWSRGGVTIFVDATNITSTEYYDYAGLVMPEVWASGGISVLF